MFEQDMEGAPQYYGFPESPTMGDWQVWNRQELFLAAYSKIGKLAKQLRRRRYLLLLLRVGNAGTLMASRKE
jgi:hypothetical protein